MNKTKDVLYAIFMGLLLYLAGAIILGGVSYFLNLFFSIDFISVILYFFLSQVITRQVLKGINSRGTFYIILFCIYTGLMYVLKDYVTFFITLVLNGYSVLDILKTIPLLMIYSFIQGFSFDLSLTTLMSGLINILFSVIEILIMAAGIYYTYRIAKNE